MERLPGKFELTFRSKGFPEENRVKGSVKPFAGFGGWSPHHIGSKILAFSYIHVKWLIPPFLLLLSLWHTGYNSSLRERTPSLR
jgi:hypothetical protein